MYVSIPTISIIVVFVGVLITYLSFKRGGIKDLKQDAKDNAILTTKLDFITQIVLTVQVKIENQDSKFTGFTERLARVEEITRANESSIKYLKGR